MAKKKKEETAWEAEEIEQIEQTETEAVKPKKKRSGAYSKNKGSSYERKIVNELKEITGDEDLCTSRSESKKLDDQKIDVADPNSILDFYVQCKSTQTNPSVKKLNAEVGRKDRPLAIFWNAQEKREVNCVSAGEYVIIPKSFFYDLLKIRYEKD